MVVKSSHAAVFDLVHHDPAAAIHSASAELERAVDGSRRAYHLWVRGLAHRELGDLTDAQTDLAEGRALALDAGDAPLAAQIAVSWSLVVLYLGHTGGALGLLDEAEPHLTGSELGSCVVQRALVLHRLGQFDVAMQQYERARRLFRDCDDRGGEARCLANFGLLLFQTGQLDRGEELLRSAIDTGLDVGHDHVAAISEQNLGCLLARRGEVGEALALLERSLERFDSLGNEMQGALARTDRAAVLLTVNLAAEAVTEVEVAWRAIGSGGNTTDIADTALLLAHARTAVGDLDGAAQAAAESRRLFEATGRDPWIPLARLAELTVTAAASSATDIASAAEQLVVELDRFMWASEAAEATLLAVRSHLRHDRVREADEVLRRTSRRHRAHSAFDRAAVQLARAHVRVASGDVGAARRAITTGLRTLLDNREAIGALDLRAHAGDHAAGLAALGVRLAVADGRAREVLWRIEAARVLGSGRRGGPSPSDPHLAELLTRTRELGARHRAATPTDRPTIRSQQLVLEERIRNHARVAGHRAASLDSATVAAWTRPDVALLEYFAEGGWTWAVTVVRGRARMHRLVPSADVAGRVEGLHFALHRMTRSRMSAASMQSAHDAFRTDIDWLAATLLPRSLDGAARLVIVPDSTTYDVPWLAVFGAAAEVSVAPSASLWQEVAARPRSSPSTVLAVAGPDLEFAAAECVAVDACYRSAESAQRSRVGDVLSKLERVDIAHFACHGTYRTDNPMFSSLRLTDGDLTVYDLEQCERLPHTVVLSACNAGQNSVLRAGALLGMASALIQLGVSSVIAPLTPVNDERSVDLMVRLHTHLADGMDAAAALARASVAPDGSLDPTAAPFICLGN